MPICFSQRPYVSATSCMQVIRAGKIVRAQHRHTGHGGSGRRSEDNLKEIRFRSQGNQKPYRMDDDEEE